jgi:uncharacterized membrane protein YbhN (UPF0104 family)
VKRPRALADVLNVAQLRASLRARFLLPALIAAATLAGFVLVARNTGAAALEAAASPNWWYLGAAFGIWAVVQPLRAWSWVTTLRTPIGFRAVYAASSIGSFLDTVLPGRLGEVSKVGVLRVAGGPQWPGLPRAGGSLLCMHLLEGIAFIVLGGCAALLLPMPGWARWTLGAGFLAAPAVIALAAVAHRRFGMRLPRVVDGFLDGAAAPLPVLVLAGAILLATWLLRWAGVLFLLHAVGIQVGPGEALIYMLVTGLANVAPILPGNAGLYQGAALGALALVGQAGAQAVAVSVLAPAVVSVAAAAAALVGLALFGRRFAELPRAALARA